MRGRDVTVQRRIQFANGRRIASGRVGFLTPAVAVALVAVLVGLALVLDRWWLGNASAELTSAAESAALAAGRELVSDDLLREADSTADTLRIERAKQAAIRLAALNKVAGQPLQLNSGDVRFGRLVRETGTGSEHFIDDPERPTTVVVTARRTRANGNPIALLLRRSDGPDAANVTRRAEATIDNHIVGVRPFSGAPVPMWPIAISEADTVSVDTGETFPGWQTQIEQRTGNDHFAYDPSTRRVVPGADGLPEIVLHGGNGSTALRGANMQLIDLGSGLQVSQLEQQIAGGITSGNLQATSGSLRFDSAPLATTGFSAIPLSLQQRLSQQVGECRIVLLSSQIDPSDAAGNVRVQCHRLVAGRVMAVRTTANGRCEIVFQPGTLATRTAVIADRNLPTNERQRFANRYIYKLQLTH